MGSDKQIAGIMELCYVSIHAPTWGATDVPLQGREARRVSIHAPTWGATPSTQPLAQTASFNPRSHMGSDILWHTDIGITVVSIHAPTWGATQFNGAHLIQPIVSIHAPTWGATVALVTTCLSLMFQSTLPHGERRSLARFVAAVEPFQSTLPHGERLVASSQQPIVSIHAPTWGATHHQRHKR